MDMDALRDRLIAKEGLRLKPYRDTVGLLTIGVGHCIERNPIPVSMDTYLALNGTITRSMAMLLLNQDIQGCIMNLSEKLPWFEKQNDVRQRVLVELCFNLGVRGLTGFKKTLAAWQKGDYNAAAEGLLNSKWATQVGHRAQEIAQMVRTGKDI